MQEPLPVLRVPGLLCTLRLYLEQIPALWRFGPVVVADHTRDDSMSGTARRILSLAPPRFAQTRHVGGEFRPSERRDGSRRRYD